MGPGISYRDWVKRAATGGKLLLSTTSGTAGLPLANVQTPRLREVASYTSNFATMRLDFNGGVLEANQWTGENGITVGCFGLFNVDLGLGATISISIYTDNDNGSAELNKSFVVLATTNYNLENTLTNVFFQLDEIYSDVQRVQVTISKSSPIEYIGRLWIGNYLEECFDEDWTIGPDSRKSVNFSQGRDAHTVFQRRSRKGTFPISQIPFETAYGVQSGVDINNTGTFNDLTMTAGFDSEIVIHPRVTNFSDTPHPPLPTTIYGLLTKDAALSHQGGNKFETQLDVLELI